MSDLQIVTGFSILISGFTQLRCGLTAYHWLLIVKLAWFSSLTHLSCLRLLRTYLYSRASERLWRLLAMGALAIMLAVGLFSTGNSRWQEEELPDRAAPAICHLGASPRPDLKNITFWQALVSALLVLIAFAARVVKSHEVLSVGFVGRVRSKLSIAYRRFLRCHFNKCCQDTHSYNLRRSLCYF